MALEQFVNLYPLSKTLRFELIPQGKTLEHIQTKGLLTQDEQLAENYKKAKKVIDDYHKDFIEKALSGIKLTKLNDFRSQYQSPKDQRDENAFGKIKEALRKEIVAAFNKDELKARFANLFKKELIKEDLVNWVDGENKELIKEFEKFTTYFTGFYENRKNMYSVEEKSTAIAYRIINENLPKFIDNINIYKTIKSNHKDLDFSRVLDELKGVIQIKSLDKIFDLDYFNNLLSQNGIDFLNSIIGGRSGKAGEKKIKGFNEHINLYNQQQDKTKRAPKFKQLYKQILSDRNSISWLPEAFETDKEVLGAINNFYREGLENTEIDGKPINILNAIETIVKSLSNYGQLDKIYLRNDTTITAISQTLFGSYGILGHALNHYYEAFINSNWVADYAKAKETKRKKLETEKNKFTKSTYLSIDVLQTALAEYVKTLDDDSDIKQKYSPTLIVDYFTDHFDAKDENGNEIYIKDKNGNETKITLTDQIVDKYNDIENFLDTERPEDDKLIQDKEDVHQLKAFLDSIMNLLHFVKPLYVDKNASEEKNELFYTEFTPLYEELAKIVPLYNKVRNYLTQKPYTVEKFKLNFENSTLLDGWDVNKERDNTAVILLKGAHYYLGIMDKQNNTIFEKIPATDNTNTAFTKVNYKLLPGANKMLPKVFFSKSRMAEFGVSEKMHENYKAGTHTKGDNFNLSDCHKLIDFFKSSIQKHEDWKHFNFKFSPTKSYEDISGFYKEVEQQGYKITFSDVSKEYVDQLVDEGKLYLFQIYNKDFSPYSKGKPNLHTLYWKALFAPENLANVIYKLNGQAEVFFRKKSIPLKKTFVHKAKEKIENKRPSASKKTSVFGYDITKDRRYTIDKFQFHVPITMNFKATGNDYINQKVNKFLRNNPDVKIIGLDRGERHLIYLTLIDQQGSIIRQESLNIIKDEQHKIETPYHELLDRKEKERDEARKSWDTIENIKELKEGYISQVVHKIVTMMIEHNAIVVLEDLNFGFKQGRFKVEKQVYQKLEKMLIDKLNYLVIKDKKDAETGGLYKALQLTNKFSSFKDIGKQTGFLFYVPAWNTSKIDPVTGFVDFLKPKYESIEQARIFLGKFLDIRFNSTEHYFEFSFDYKDFTTKAEETRTEWTICTHGERIETFRNPDKSNKWDNQDINLSKEFELIFNKYHINYRKGENLKESILKQTEKAFFERLMYLLRLTLQIRNSKTGTDTDYLISPVPNKDGNFYNSGKVGKELPQNADANGAYNIARKGLWILQQIKKTKTDDDLKKLKLAISNKEWLQFVQNSGRANK